MLPKLLHFWNLRLTTQQTNERTNEQTNKQTNTLLKSINHSPVKYVVNMFRLRKNKTTLCSNIRSFVLRINNAINVRINTM